MAERFNLLLSDQTDMLLSPHELVMLVDTHYVAREFVPSSEKVKLLGRTLEFVPNDAASRPFRTKLYLLGTLVILDDKDKLWKDYRATAEEYAEEAYQLAKQIDARQQYPQGFERQTLLIKACVHRGVINYANGLALVKAAKLGVSEPIFLAGVKAFQEAIALQPAVEVSFRNRHYAASCAWEVYVDRSLRKVAVAQSKPLLTEAKSLLEPVVESTKVSQDDRAASKLLLDKINRELAKM
jgi:hypothetical protein